MERVEAKKQEGAMGAGAPVGKFKGAANLVKNNEGNTYINFDP